VSRPGASWAFAVTAVLLLIFWLDRATGAAPVQHLYYLPIIAAALAGGLRAGVPAAVAAIALYHAANPRLLTFAYGEWDIVQVLLFVAVGVTTAKLAEDRTRLRQLASTDDLTGLSNLRAFEARLLTLVRAARHEGTALALLVLDLDRLKTLNDAHGHLAGAEAVRTVGRVIADRLPADAVACRYGGDEFVVALPRCTEAGAHHVADAIRKGVRDAAPVLARVQFPRGTLTVSIGLVFAGAEFSRAAEDEGRVGEALFRAADDALYRAKAAGRNQVCRVFYSLSARVS
jgi:diguanylate cyclase (GGDEF)-like protein